MNYSKAWLNYVKIDKKDEWDYNRILLRCDSKDLVIQNGIKELKKFFLESFDVELEVREADKSEADFIHKVKEDNNFKEIKKETVTENKGKNLILDLYSKNDLLGLGLEGEGYYIHKEKDGLYLSAITNVGLLYGVFCLIRTIRLNRPMDKAILENPSNPLRMLNHWDNMDGSIERGYAGTSIFFQTNEIIINDRTYEYARLCASIAINGVAINNVNVKEEATYLITEKHLDKLALLADIFASYGIKLFLSINFAAAVEMGELITADPLNEEVMEWWSEKTKVLYDRIPSFGGYLVKADSEFRPGPFTYNRTHSDGANMLGRALKPFGGILIWRCFVYNCKQDWRDKKTDRAKAAYDHFLPLDGQFDDNVILQIKNGPMDFQVREPVSPLLGALKNTNELLEFQITQEYTGQQKHVCYLVPMWKEILEFDTYCRKGLGKVSQIVSGKTFPMSYCGITAVSNVGNDYNWNGHDLAAANWYGYGRLIFCTDLSPEEIAEEWIVSTYGNQRELVENILKILLSSWPSYEKYTSPLGIGWMVNPNHHYGPNVDGYEYAKWGTYHRADWKGIGVDRTTKGTGYTMQYQEANATMYESMNTCPEELLLFFHYVSYDYVLKSGKTLIQHIYDTHFEGVEDVEYMLELWKEIKNQIDEDSYNRVLERLEIQLESSMEWRDMINTYFYRKSGRVDKLNRTICD